MIVGKKNPIEIRNQLYATPNIVFEDQCGTQLQDDKISMTFIWNKH